MIQSEFDAELASGKRSWEGTHVPSDLDLSGRLIEGDLNLSDAVIDGDLDLSGTTITGSLNLWCVSVEGNLDLSGLRVNGGLKCLSENGGDILSDYGLISVEGEIISDDLVVNGEPLKLPRRYTRVPLEDRTLRGLQ